MKNTIHFSYSKNNGVASCSQNMQQITERDEYFIFDTLQKMYYFNVDNRLGSLTITEVYSKPPDVFGGAGPDELRFTLWEDGYKDIIYPGKREIIHKETLVRSIEHYGKGHIIHLSTFNDVEKLLCCLQNNDFEIEKGLVIIYEPNVLMLSSLDLIYVLLKRYLKSETKMYFKPNSSCFECYNFESFNWETFDLKTQTTPILNDDEDLWLVYSKTHRHQVHIVSGYANACRLLAKLKFNLSIPFFQCGVSLFEDYYFMPIQHKEIDIDPYTNHVTCRKMIKSVKNLRTFLADALNQK